MMIVTTMVTVMTMMTAEMGMDRLLNFIWVIDLIET